MQARSITSLKKGKTAFKAQQADPRTAMEDCWHPRHFSHCFCCFLWPRAADFLVPSWRKVMIYHHVSPTFGSHSFYVPFVRLWERVSTLTFSTSQSSRSTYKSIKSPKIISAPSGFWNMAFLRHLPSFHPSKKFWSPLLPLGIHVP